MAGGVGLPQQPNLRLKLEAWAKSKGHQGLAELLVHQQRVAQQRATAQQQGNVVSIVIHLIIPILLFHI